MLDAAGLLKESGAPKRAPRTAAITELGRPKANRDRGNTCVSRNQVAKPDH